MKKLSIKKIETISANGTGQTIVGGVSCGWGLAVLASAPFTFGISGVAGAAFVIAGCGSLIGDW